MAQERKTTGWQAALKAVERKALARKPGCAGSDFKAGGVHLVTEQQRRRLERRSAIERITSNGTVSAFVMIAAAVAALAAGIAGASEIPATPDVVADVVEVTDWKDIDGQNVFAPGENAGIVEFHTVTD